VDEAASIDILCSDKTGTLTRNELAVTGVRPLPGFDEAQVLGMAAVASSEGGQDPVDGAIRLAALQKPASGLPKLVAFVPFDPVKKTSEATATDPKGGLVRIIKGAFTAVVALSAPSPAAAAIVDELEKQGFRVLAVAAGKPRFARSCLFPRPPAHDRLWA
jgi:H+-transporting ATPase